MEISEKELKILIEEAFKNGWSSSPELAQEYSNQVVESVLESKKITSFVSNVFSTSSDLSLGATITTTYF